MALSPEVTETGSVESSSPSSITIASRAHKDFDRVSHPKKSQYATEYFLHSPVGERFFQAPIDVPRKTHTKWQTLAFAFRTLGIVYGDLGTSPLRDFCYVLLNMPAHRRWRANKKNHIISYWRNSSWSAKHISKCGSVGVGCRIGSAVLLSKLWNQQGCVPIFTYYGDMVIDDPYGGNVQHHNTLPNCFQGIFPSLYL